MSTDRGPLPDDIVGAIFTKLSLVYGGRFTRAYEQDVATVRAHWGVELSGMSMQSVRYALDHLPPDHPPNVLQFRAIAACRPPDDYKALPAPLASADIRAQHREALNGLREPFAQALWQKNPVAWAERILASPQGHSRASIQLAKEALAAKGRLP